MSGERLAAFIAERAKIRARVEHDRLWEAKVVDAVNEERAQCIATLELLVREHQAPRYLGPRTELENERDMLRFAICKLYAGRRDSHALSIRVGEIFNARITGAEPCPAPQTGATIAGNPLVPVAVAPRTSARHRAAPLLEAVEKYARDRSHHSRVREWLIALATKERR